MSYRTLIKEKPVKTIITLKQLNNLKRIREYMKTVPQKFIDMESFRCTDSNETDFISMNDCGTSGCIIGHAPFAPHRNLKPITSDFSRDYSGLTYMTLDFDAYCERVFGIDSDSDDWYKVFAEGKSSRKDHINSRLTTLINRLEKNGRVST